MNEAQKHFSIFLVNNYFEDLHEDLDRYAQKVAEAIKQNNKTDVDLYLGLIARNRKILDEIQDVNKFLCDYFNAILEYEGDEE